MASVSVSKEPSAFDLPIEAEPMEESPEVDSKSSDLPAMGSVEFITKEITLVLNQMMPLDLYNAAWRHHYLHQHSTLPIWDRMPMTHLPTSGHQLGADQKLVRAFDGFRPLPPPVSTFYLEIQIRAAAELSTKLGRYIHPGKAIEPSKQVPVPKRLCGVVPRFSHRHVNFL